MGYNKAVDARKLTMTGPADVARTLAERVRVLRLHRGWTQKTLAERAGVTVASYRRFETTGQASLELVLKVAHALARLEEFERLLEPPSARTMQELEERTTGLTRKRGRS